MVVDAGRRRAAPTFRSACWPTDELLDGVEPAERPRTAPSTATSRRSSTRRARPGRRRACSRPWATIYQMWSWVPDRRRPPRRGPLLPRSRCSTTPGSRRSTASLVRGGAASCFRDKFSATQLLGRRPRAPTASVATLVGPMTALLHAPSPAATTTPTTRCAAVLLGPMIPEMEAFERRFGVAVGHLLRPDRDRRSVRDGLGPRALADLRPPRDDYPWHRGAPRRRARRTGARWARSAS